MSRETGGSISVVPDWESHACTLILWPGREEVWEPYLYAARQEYAQLAHAISNFEPVVILHRPGQGGEVVRQCGSGVKLWELESDDSWIRDTGPIFIRSYAQQNLGAAKFRFDSWGQKFKPFFRDARIAEEIITRLALEWSVSSGIVLEGGAVSANGMGDLIATETSILHGVRNPGVGKAEVEEELSRCLGASNVIWLPYGLVDDVDTDGHVDNVARFTDPNTVLALTAEDSESPDSPRLLANLDVLRSARTTSGQKLKVVPISSSAYAGPSGATLRPLSPLNFVLTNGGIIVPVQAMGALAPHIREAFNDLFPERSLVEFPAPTMAFGGGGTHCVTLEVPVGLRLQ